jgi:hypothetical protein
MAVDFTWAGHHHHVTRGQVLKRLHGAQLGPVRTHAVEVDGVLFPVKEALSHVIGEDVLDFNTNQARAVFRRLGFELSRVED